MAAPATITVFDNLYSASGVAVVNANVYCVLNGTQETTSGGLIQPTQQVTTTDGNGRFAFTVVCNDLLSPANSTYTIITPFRTYDIAPQSANGNPQQTTAANVIVNTPVAIAPWSTVTGPLTVGGTLGVTGLLTASGGEVISGGTGATLNASGDLAVRSVTVSSGSGPYVSTALAGGADIGPTRLGGPQPWIDVTAPSVTIGGTKYVLGAKYDGVTDDTIAHQNLITALNITAPDAASGWPGYGRGRLGHGLTVISAPLGTLTNYRSAIIGPGVNKSMIKYTGTGTCLKVHENPFTNVPASPAPQSIGPELRGFGIDGGGATAGAVGLEYGDVVGGTLDLLIQHFNGVGSINCWLRNTTNWCERNRINLRLSDGTTCLKLSKDDTNNNTVSFAYNEFDLQLTTTANQTGIALVSTAGSALDFYSGRLFVMANMATPSTLIDLSTNSGNVTVLDALVDIRAEGPATCTFINIPATAEWRTFGVMINGITGITIPNAGTGVVEGVHFGLNQGGAAPGVSVLTVTGRSNDGRIDTQKLHVNGTGVVQDPSVKHQIDGNANDVPLAFKYLPGGADAKMWDWLLSANTLAFRLTNDVYGAATNWLTVVRAGITISSITFGGNVTLPSLILTGNVPAVGAGQVGFGNQSAASATTGASGAPPAQVAGYLIANVAGTTAKIPYYNN